MATSRVLAWVGTRVLVAAGAVGLVLSLAQLFVHALVSAFSSLTPYAGP